MNLHAVRLDKPDDVNLIFGQSHFIKTVEDLHEAMATSAMGIKFGIAFCEASGDQLIRKSGNDDGLVKLAVDNLQKVSAGHTFLIMMTGGFPIHVMRAVRAVPEVCSVFCATANAVEVIVAETDLGRGVLGVIDGQVPLGVEGDADTAARKGFLRKIGYKL
ncbi:MAG: adenosine-specific kinase [Deltaproteobacteria bacterium]|nr:adenosine-specific kinase [Deltaproteobacteria bacterium]